MLEQGSGHIVNVSSVAGHISPPYMGMYAATKHALAAVSDALRIELGGTGVGVSTIFPGLTDTAFTKNMLQEVEAPQIPPIARFVGANVVARRIFQAVRWGLRDVYVSPEDVASVMMDATMPLVMDWGMRLFMRPGPRQDVSFESVPKLEEPTEAAE
jgi:short-subunit dehydrogenase